MGNPPTLFSTPLQLSDPDEKSGFKMAKMSFAHETTTLPNSVRYEARPVVTPQDAMRATIHVTLNHMAEVFRVVMKAVSERYGIDQEEMMNVVAAHPEYASMLENPVLKDLGYDLQVDGPGPAAAAPVVAPPVVELKKRGRPKGSKNKTPRKAAAAVTTAPEPVAAAADTASVVSAGSLVPGKRYTIAQLKAHLKAKKAAAEAHVAAAAAVTDA